MILEQCQKNCIRQFPFDFHFFFYYSSTYNKLGNKTNWVCAFFFLGVFLEVRFRYNTFALYNFTQRCSKKKTKKKKKYGRMGDLMHFFINFISFDDA